MSDAVGIGAPAVGVASPIADAVPSPADQAAAPVVVQPVAPVVPASPASPTPKTEINVHPKVFAGFLTGLGITVATGVAAYVTPDTLEFLGPWAAPAAGLVGTGITLLVSWLKKSTPAA